MAPRSVASGRSRTSTPSMKTVPGGGSCKPGKQRDQRRLAGAGDADQRHRLARPQSLPKRDQNRRCRRTRRPGREIRSLHGLRDRSNAEPAELAENEWLCGLCELCGPLSRIGGYAIQHFQHPLPRRHAALEHVGDPAERNHRPAQHRQVRVERDELADRDPSPRSTSRLPSQRTSSAPRPRKNDMLGKKNPCRTISRRLRRRYSSFDRGTAPVRRAPGGTRARRARLTAIPAPPR